MGTFLAALGAVLLFIPKVIGILLLVVLVLALLLLLCPFCADLCWEHGVFTVKAGAAARAGKSGAAQRLWQSEGKICSMAR